MGESRGRSGTGPDSGEQALEGIASAGPVRLFYRLEGNPAGPVVTFVHGLAASLAVWDGQARRLEQEFRLLRYDLRGHGRSSASGRPCTRSELARDLARLLGRVGIERTVVVGHSAGGVIAMHLALEHPERVSGLVLVGTASECNDKTAAWYERTASKARAGGGQVALRAMGMPPDAPVPDGAEFAELALAMRSLNQEPLTDRLAAVSAPTLVVVGEKDFLGVGGSVIIHRAIPGSELEIVPGRGHGIYLEDPDWFADRLRRFVRERVQAAS